MNAVRHAERACELEPNEPFSYTALSVTYRNASQAADNAHDNQRFIHLAEEAMARSHTFFLELAGCAQKNGSQTLAGEPRFLRPEDPHPGPLPKGEGS